MNVFGAILGRENLRLQAAQIASIRADLGIGVMQAEIAARDRMLVPVLPDCIGWQLESWLVLHSTLCTHPMIRLVADHLSKVLPAVLKTGHLPS